MSKYGNAFVCKHIHPWERVCLSAREKFSWSNSSIIIVAETMTDSVCEFDESQTNKLTDIQPKPSGTSMSKTATTSSSLLPNGNHSTTVTFDTGGENMDKAGERGDTMELEVADREGTDEVDYENAESQAIRQVHSYLVDGFTHQVDQLASEFYQEFLIEANEYSRCTCACTPSSKRATDLLQVLTSKIRIDSGNFDKFVNVLENHDSFTSCVQAMRERHRELSEKLKESRQASEPVSLKFTRPVLTKQQSSIASVGSEELQIEIDEIEKRLESVRKGVGRRKGRKDRELQLTRQEVIQLKQRLDQNERQLDMSNFQSKFYQEQLLMAQTQIAQLTREVVELKQQRPPCESQCQHYRRCKLLEKDNEKLENIQLEHLDKIANLNAQIAYLLDRSEL